MHAALLISWRSEFLQLSSTEHILGHLTFVKLYLFIPFQPMAEYLEHTVCFDLMAKLSHRNVLSHFKP